MVTLSHLFSLINVVVEALLINILMERAKSEGLIRGVQFGNGDLVVTHLQFADDTIFFCNNNIEHANVVYQKNSKVGSKKKKRILRWFQVSTLIWAKS